MHICRDGWGKGAKYTISTMSGTNDTGTDDTGAGAGDAGDDLFYGKICICIYTNHNTNNIYFTSIYEL